MPATWQRIVTGAVCLCWLATVASAQIPGPLGKLLTPGQQKNAGESAATSQTQGAVAPPASIPLPDVATRAEELKRTLLSVSSQLPSDDQLKGATATLDERGAELSQKAQEVDAMLSSSPTSLELREQDNYWRTQQHGTSDLRQQLFAWANAAQKGVQTLQEQRPLWQATLQQNQGTSGLGPALEVIQQALAKLHQLDLQAQSQLKIIVNLQVRAANQDQLALDTLDRIARAREYIVRRLLERDSLPLWQLQQRRHTGETNEFYAPAAERLRNIRSFAMQTKGALLCLFALLLFSLLGSYRLRVALRGAQPTTPRQAEVMVIARHWVALGSFGPLLATYLLAPLAPVPLIGLTILVSYIPILILLPPLLQPRMRVLLYCMSGVYLLHSLIGWSNLAPFHKREIRFGVDLAVLVLFAYLMRPGRVSRSANRAHHHPVRIFAIRVGVVVLGFSLLADLAGYLKLSQFLNLACFYSTFVAISMLTAVRVFSRLMLEGLDTDVAQQLAIVRLHREGVARWLPRALQLTGGLIWSLVTINLLGLGPWLSDKFAQLREFHIAGGSAGITLGGVIGFFLILLVGYGISSAIRFLLREELLSRFHLARGVPEVISSTLHYLLLLLVFFFAVNAGGVELNKFTVLTGALGVGVGFGLQNIVNNFISGLILQFERPIHVGDVLEVDGSNGTVTRIGIRSSTIRTFQGAELIIPNGNFVSGKVTNWTLTSPKRRLELPIGVAYGSDAKLVTELLNQAATTNESVLTDPPPSVYFKQFGDSALNFELHFWVMQESNTSRVKSEVALGVMELLNQAGVEIPFPQRDLRLRAVDPEAAAALIAPNGLKAEYGADADAPNAKLFEKAQRQRAGE